MSKWDTATIFPRVSAFALFVVLGFVAGCGGGSASPSSNLSSSPPPASAGPGASSSSNPGASSAGSSNGGGSSAGGAGSSGTANASSTGAFLYAGLDDTYATSYGVLLPRTGHASIAGFSIASDGSLQPTPGSPYSGAAALLAANASVSALYAASGSNINVEHINSDGSLTTTATLNAQPLSSTVGIYWDLSFDARAQLLYALAAHGSGTSFWEIYKAGSDGSLSSAGSQGGGPAAAHLYFTPDGKRAFSPECYHLDGAIWGYSVGPGNNLTSFDTKAQVPNFGSSFPACPFAMSITSDGTRLAAQLNPKTVPAAGVAIYSVNGDGTLTAQPGSLLTTSAQGSDIAWDPLGRYIAVGAKDGLWIYSSTSGSAPAPVGGVPIVTGSIDHVAFNKAGTLLFAVNASAQNIYVFNFNGSTGAATPAPGSPHSMNLAPYELVVAER